MRPGVRFSFFRIVVLSLLVLCGHTAHAAHTAARPFQTTPCRVWARSVPPTAQERSARRLRLALRPGGDAPASRFLALASSPLHPLPDCAFLARQASVHAYSLLLVAPRPRSFALRI